MGEALNHPLLRYRALLRGRGLFAAKVDLVQREVEHVRRDVEFVGCVGAEPEEAAPDGPNWSFAASWSIACEGLQLQMRRLKCQC
jgi:hypothetical protein